MPRRTIAPGPETRQAEQQRREQRREQHVQVRQHRRPFFTKGSYFALGWLSSAGLLAWTGHLDIAVYWYAIGGVLFVLFCGPMVALILHKLAEAMTAHHEQMPAVHGAWLHAFCPTCEALYGKA